MKVTRKRVRFGGVTTFVDPRSDLVLDKKKRIFLHYLPETKGESKNSLRYQLVKYNLGYYVKFLGFFDFETAARSHLRKLADSDSGMLEIQNSVSKVIHKLPYRAREIINQTTTQMNEPNSPHDTFYHKRTVEENGDWVERVAESFSIMDFIAESEAVLVGKSGSEHKFDLVVTSKQGEEKRIAFLNKLSEDTVEEIMLFNALANDCNINLKVISIDRDLADPAIHLLNEYHISIYDKRSNEFVNLASQIF